MFKVVALGLNFIIILIGIILNLYTFNEHAEV